jgi:hypothetical protein|tara:strand:- start:3468 stop:4193 length:726 start_codon:yes stop_codon:yes gene_type:complete
MQVIDILTENKKVDEGPVRFLKRTLGKNTATGKAAQLDVELDKEVNKLYKEFFAVSKQDPQLKGMTAKGLANYIVSKGFAGKPSDVMRFINQQPGAMRTAKKGAKAVAKGAKALGTGVGAVAGTIKKAVTPKDTNLTPQGKQMELPLAQSMYGESTVTEVDAQLSKAQVKKVLKGFVRKGFQAQLGKRMAKSDYGDADSVAQKGAEKKLAKVGVDTKLAKSITSLQKQGYKVIPPKTKQTA